MTAWYRDGRMSTKIRFALSVALASAATFGLSHILGGTATSVIVVCVCLCMLGFSLVRRQLNAAALLQACGALIPLVFMALPRDVTRLVPQEDILLGMAGLILLLSVALGRPVLYLVASRYIRSSKTYGTERNLAALEARETRSFLRLLTLVFGLTLSSAFALGCVLFHVLQPVTFSAVNPVVTLGSLGCLSLISAALSKRRISAKTAGVNTNKIADEKGAHVRDY